MKQSIRTLTALLLSFVLILSCMAGCAQPGTDPSGQPADTTESTKTGTTTPGVVIKETDPPETLPVPVEQEETTQFPEALEAFVGFCTEPLQADKSSARISSTVTHFLLLMIVHPGPFEKAWNSLC